MVKDLVKKLANGLLSKVNLAVCRQDTLKRAGKWSLEHERHLLLLQEVDSVFRTTVFPELPQCSLREELMTELIGASPTKAYHILNYLYRALRVPGDVCELGVAEGATSALLANELKGREDRTLWLFDSFQGLPRPTEKDILLNDIFKLGSMEGYAGMMAVPKDSVLGRLKRVGFPSSRLKLVAGFIEQVVKTAKLPDQVCFAYVDFDFYEPIAVALEMLDSRMPVGGYIVVDDYGFFSSGAATATDEFVAKKKGKFTLIKPQPFTGGFAILSKNA